jgi:hypothetical protein
MNATSRYQNTALRLLHLYPRAWRERYAHEVSAVLEERPATLRTVIDLLLGALDARLNSIYRPKGGPMFQNVRDHRSLSLIYLCALTVFLLLNSFWLPLILLGSPDFLIGRTESTIMANPLVNDVSSLIPVATLIALLGGVCLTIGNAIKKSQWGALTFALLCLGVTSWLLWFTPSLLLEPSHSSLSDLLRTANPALILLAVLPPFFFGGGLFLIGVKSLQLLRKRQRWPLLFALLVGLLAPASYLFYFWASDLGYTSGGLSLTQLILTVCFEAGIYLALSGILLTLATGTVTRRGWQTAQICGVLLTVLLLARLISIVLGDVFHWINGGGVWIFDPLLIHALFLALALAIMVLALLRSFLIPAEESLPTPARA